VEKEPEHTLVVGGLYRHFKKNDYLVLRLDNDPATGEIVVHYLALYAPYAYCRRRVSNFFEHMVRPEYNYEGPRFVYVKTLTENSINAE
jgi:hypothetical protein